MKVVFPTKLDQGTDSVVYGHFGSAQAFVVVDAESGEVDSVLNADRVHEHGMCQPLAALGGREVDAVVVGGIGAGALRKLNAAGIRVHRAAAGTVAENLSLMRAGRLPELTLRHTCAGHGRGSGCGSE